MASAEDITPQTSVIDTPQPEAVQNIQGANVFGISPDVYKSQKEFLQPVLDAAQLPPVASPVVAAAIKQSPEHAAAIAPDANKLSGVEEMFNSLGDTLKKSFSTQYAPGISILASGDGTAPTNDYLAKQIAQTKQLISTQQGPQNEMDELNYKKMLNGGKFDDDDDKTRLMALRLSAQDNFGAKDYGIEGYLESKPSEIIAQGVDMGALAYRNAGLIAKITGGVVGSTALTGGLIAGPAGALTGAGIGLVPGLETGYLAATFWDQYKKTAARTYNDLDTAMTPGPVSVPFNMDEENKHHLSVGVGAVAGTLAFAADKFLLKVPGLRALTSPKGVSELVTNPANSAMKTALTTLGHAMIVGGAMGGLNATTEIIGNAIKDTYDGTDVSVANGLASAAKQILDLNSGKAKQIGEATASGGIDLAAIGMALHLAGSATAHALAKKTDLVGPQEPIAQQATKALQVQDTFNAVSDTIKDTKLHKLAPDQILPMKRQMLSNIGINELWADPNDLKEWIGDDPKKQKSISIALDDNAKKAIAVNAPVKLDAATALQIHDEHPDFSSILKTDPEGMNAKSAENFANEIDAKKQRAKEISAQLGVYEKAPEERAYSDELTKLNPSHSDEEISQRLGTKEVASAYLDRLDVNDQFEKDKEQTPQERDQKLSDIQTLRERVTKLKENLPNDESAKEILRRAANVGPAENDIYGESDYLNQNIFTKPVEGVISDTRVKELSEHNRKIREEVASRINDDAARERSRVVDINAANADEVQRQIEEDRIANDPNIAVVEKFKNSKFTDEESKDSPHHKNGFSRYAIDPRLLDEAQKKKYAKDPQLKENGAFVKGGMSPNDAAELIGVNSGENLLKILANTKDRESTIEEGIKRNKKANLDRAEGATPVNDAALARAYHAVVENHLQESKIAREIGFSKYKKGILTFALPVPTPEEVISKGNRAVEQTKIGDLNANQFAVGERKSQGAATKNAVDHDWRSASENKERAALNAALRSATLKAIKDVNGLIDFAKKFNDKNVLAELNRAGKVYAKAADEILETFNLKPQNSAKTAERGSFMKFVDQQIKAGNSNYTIPERLSDTRVQFKDMTVEQARVIHDRLKSIYDTAQRKNELLLKYGDDVRHVQEIAREVDATVKQNPDFDLKKSDENSGKLTATQGFIRTTSDAAAYVANAESITTQVDGKVAGVLTREVISRLNGNGEFKGQGAEGKTRDVIEHQAKLKDVRDKYNGDASVVGGIKKALNVDEWSRMHSKSINVPEWENNDKLNNGKLSVGHLFQMMLNMGNEGNISKLETGYGIDRATIYKVLNRELESRHSAAAQGIWNVFKELGPRVQNLHEDMTGTRPDLVEATPFMHNGKVHEGGYYPIIGTGDFDYSKLIKRNRDAIKAMSGEKKIDLSDYFYASDMTKHGHTEARTDATNPISLKMSSTGMGIEAMLHDLNYRKPISDSLKILTHDDIAKNIAATAGKAKYNVLLNSVVHLAGSAAIEKSALLDSGKFFDKLQHRASTAFSTGTLIFRENPLTIAFSSVPLTLREMGATGSKHYVKVLSSLVSNPAALKDAYREAARIHTGIFQSQNGVDSNARSTLRDQFPKDHYNSVTAAFDGIRESAAQLGFHAIDTMHTVPKVIAVLAAYSQHLAGEAPGHTSESMAHMTPEEKNEAAQKYAASIARLTTTSSSDLDKAPVQRDHPNLTMFWNDTRNQLNASMRIGREAKQDVQLGNYGKAATGAATGLMTYAAMRLLLDVSRGHANPIIQTSRYGDQQFDDSPEGYIKYLAYSAPEVLADATPVIRDAKYAVEKALEKEDRTGKSQDINFTPPMLAQVNSMLTGGVGLARAAMEFMHGETAELSAKEKVGVADIASVVTGGLPVKAMFDLYKMLPDNSSQVFVPPLAEDYSKQLEEYKKAQEAAGKSADNNTTKALEQIQKQISPPEPTKTAADDMPALLDKIKAIESDGDQFAKNPKSSAAGLYQFTEDTWDGIKEQAPQLGLTTNGRTASADQQEKAMEWFTKQNMKTLTKNDIPLTTENIYAAHFLGVNKAVEILQAPATAKLRPLIGNDAMEANDFPKSMKVKDFKTWLADKVESVSEDDSSVAKLDK